MVNTLEQDRHDILVINIFYHYQNPHNTAQSSQNPVLEDTCLMSTSGLFEERTVGATISK